MSLANQFIMLSKKILKRKTEYYPKIYYNRDVNEFFDYNTKDFVSVRNSQNKNNNFVKKRSSQFKLNFFARKFSKKLFFVFNNYKIYDYYFKKIFYGINIVKYEQDYYEDLIDKNILSDLELNSNMIRYKRNNNYKDCNRIDNLTEKYVTEINLSNQEDELSIEFFIKNGFKRKFRKALSINYSNTDTSFLNNLYEFEEKIKPDNPNKEEKDVIKRYSLDNQNEEFFNNNLNPNERGDSGNELNRGIKRQRHVEHKKLKNYLDDSSESKNSLEESILLKSDFEKVSFEVNICYYFSKDPKIIDIHKDGIFSIYKKGKMDDILSSTLSDIIKIEGEIDSNVITLTANFNDNKKILSIEFKNNFEKFIFKSIFFNRMIDNLPQIQHKSEVKLNVNVITWNVAGIDVPDDLGILFNTKSLESVDIFTIGVQECSVFKINDWQKHLKTLMTYYGFLDVTSIHMCQMFLIVFIRTQYLPFVENITHCHKPMGFAKIVGNKGGVGISFKLFGYNLTFINCHLAPKPYKVLERNNHAKNIVKYLNLGEKYADFDITSDYLFWQGDLNYRVDFSFDETLKQINKGNIKLLLLKDQLIKQRQTNQVFYEFQEPDIYFNPTYRRKKGTDEYSNKKNQSPSWCDRIMVKTDRDVDLNYYDCVKDVKHSDHLPVLGKFSIYLSIPRFNEIEKIMTKSLSGKITYSNIKIDYDFAEAFSEMNIEEKYPMKVKILAYYFLNKLPAESDTMEIKNILQFEEIVFNELELNLPPQCVFDLPHARAINIIFVINLTIAKNTYDMGFAKYSFEKVEKENLNFLSHYFTSDITLRTRRMGVLSFDAEYKF